MGTKLAQSLRSDIASLTDKVKSQIVSKKKKRITEVERQISSFSENVQNDSATLEKCVGITYQINDEMSDSEICAWLKILSEFAPDVSNELKLNERLQAEIAQFETLYAEMDAKIATEQDTEVSAIQINSERIAVLLPRGVSKKKYIDMISAAEDTSGEELVSGKIAVMYVDEVKGIEFDKVYVIPNNMGRNEKYIAYTRALSELIIVIDESVST